MYVKTKCMKTAQRELMLQNYTSMVQKCTRLVLIYCCFWRTSWVFDLCAHCLYKKFFNHIHMWLKNMSSLSENFKLAGQRNNFLPATPKTGWLLWRTSLAGDGRVRLANRPQHETSTGRPVRVYKQPYSKYVAMIRI